MKRLNKALDNLINFLSLANESHWAKLLSEIKNELNQPDKREEALKSLGSCFGGMGSLNDLYICKEYNNIPQGYTAIDVNKKLDKLMDNLFKEYKLVSLNPLSRILWKILEFKYRNDFPPRIKNAFKK
ncbi:MAG: hypothetical protein HY919_04155 [Elusimicrobia bacterium]|nr:hypothetical protein [Elusimicrobiota bacterium]